MGNPDTDQLLALKRLSFGGSAHAKLQFPGQGLGSRAPGGGHVILHLISDSYLGLDQRFDVVCRA